MRKLLFASLCVACVGPFLALEPLAAPDRSTAFAARAATRAPRAYASATRQGRQRNPASVPSCSGTGSNSFVGGGLYNVADGPQSAVLGGEVNKSCGEYAVIGGGYANGTANNDDFIGAGYLNGTTGTEDFIGAGAYNAATAPGDFVGAGDSVYLDTQPYGHIIPGNVVSGEDSFVGAGDLNQVSGQGSFIGAGGSTYAATGATVAGNQVSGVDSFIGAGDQNNVRGFFSFIGGGLGNAITAAAAEATIAGGDHNTAAGEYAAIAGGYDNSATASAATVGGGTSSSATGKFATIPGGYLNAANGIGSFAAGTLAKARHNGAFVWSDNNGTAEVQSTAPYQFVARASGGFYLYTDATERTGVKINPGSGTWSSLSDRSTKTGVTALDDAVVLAKVTALPVSEWSYTSEHGIRHVGPMAQDFYAAFRVGEDDRHITSIDEDGVALAAIKALASENHGLQTKTRGLDVENRELHQESCGLHAENRELRQETGNLRARLARQDTRLAALERKVAALAVR